MFNPTDRPQMVEHPDWCDRTRCTATPACSAGEAHRGKQTTFTIEGDHPALEITANLYQSKSVRRAAVDVDVEIRSLNPNFPIACGEAFLPFESLCEIGQTLAGLAEEFATEIVESQPQGPDDSETADVALAERIERDERETVAVPQSQPCAAGRHEACWMDNPDYHWETIKRLELPVCLCACHTSPNGGGPQ